MLACSHIWNEQGIKGMGATRQLVDFIIGTKYEDLPPEAINTAKGCILDYIGVSLVGSVQPIAKVLESYLKVVGGTPRSTVIGLGTKTSSVHAAFANGAIGHAIDYDDNALIAQAHPTVTILPAVLALAEATGVTGKEVLLAYTVGYETFSKLGAALNPSHWYKGFHSTGTFGTYGAVAGASKLLKLDSEQMTNAFGIAGSSASGLKQNFGTMTKPFHAGHAAEGGVKAALLAKDGFTAAKDVLEGRLGFARVMAEKQDLTVFANLGAPWGIVDSGGVNTSPFIKPFPSCGATHAAMEALFSLIREYDIKPDKVKFVDAGMNLGGVESLPYAEPIDSLQGKFSMQFCLAIVLLERKAGLAQFTDEKVRDPKTRKLMKRIALSVDPDLAESLPLELCDKTATVRIRMTDGREYKRTADLRHLTWGEITSKFEECVSSMLKEDEIRKMIDLTTNLERLKDLSPLVELIHR